MAEPPASPPSWAEFWTAAASQSFLHTVQELLTARDMAPSIDAETGMVTVTIPDTEEQRTFSLHSLATLSAAADPEADMAAFLAPQLEAIFENYTDNVTAGDLDADWSAAQQALQIRIHPLLHVRDSEDILLFRPIGGDLAAVLVYDLPQSIFSVSPAVAADWAVDAEVIWSTALDNLRAISPPPNVQAIALGGVDALLIEGQSFFVSSWLLLLEEILQPQQTTHGALVIVPHRHAVVVHPIVDQPQTMAALHELILLADEMFDSPAGALSSDVFWWTAEAIWRIAVTIDDDAGEILIDPPEPFAEMVAALSADEE